MFDHLTYFKEMGRHSNIPECCIEFFCYKWNIDGWSEEERNERWGKVYSVGPYKYAPCDDCLEIGKIVELHFCNEKCAEFIILLGKATRKPKRHTLITLANLF